MNDIFNIQQLNEIRDILLSRKETISVAESVTAGFIQLGLSQPANASKFFEGGVAVYNVGQKAKHLNVSPIVALDCDSVSQAVSEQMAISVSKSFMSTYGLAITGYATKVAKDNIDTLYAYLSISYKGVIIKTEKIEAAKNMEGLNCQHYYVNKMFEMFLKQLQST